MKTGLITRIRARLGDFWWNAGIQFVASRSGDAINAFIGLWLVPRYVGASELGAVLPLASFGVFLGMPISVFSTAFSKQVNVLAVRGEWGKLKTMLRGVFVAAFVFLVLAVVASRFLMPLVLERVRVAEGLLGVVILASALSGSVAPIYTNTLRALKRFNTIAVIDIVSSPLRLVVMLAAMPLRALTGYFVGQTAAPTFQICASVFAMRRELGPSVKAEPCWDRRMVRTFGRYMGLLLVSSLAGAVVAFVEPLIIRQRLPEVDSAAYYFISRFAEIGSYFGLSLTLVLFPYVSEESEKGGNGNRIVFRSMFGSLAFGVLCALILAVLGRPVLSLLPGGASYVSYVPEMVALTLIMALNMAVGCHIGGETASNRFGWIWWSVPQSLVYCGVLLLLTGYGYLRGHVPDAWVDAIAGLDAARLDFILGLMALSAVSKAVCVAAVYLLRRRRDRKDGIE